MKKAIRILATGFIALIYAGGALAQEVRVGYWASGSSAAIGLVIQEGKFLEAEGLKPKWTTTTQLAELNRALISKSIDIVLSGGTVPSLRLGVEKVPAKIILANLVADANFVVPKNSPIKSVADLKNKKVGSTPPGSTMYALVGAILGDGYGMTKDEIKQIPSGEAQLLTFLQRGEIDAAVIRTITLRTLGAQADLRILSTVPDEWKKLIGVDAPPILGLTVVDQGFAEQHMDLTIKYLIAHIKATQWGAKNPEKVAQILERGLQMNASDAEALAATWSRTYIATFDEADITSLQRMAKVFAASGNFSGDVEQSAFMTEPYQKAKASIAASK